MRIDKSFVSDLPAVAFDGVYRVLACLPETPVSRNAFPHVGELFGSRRGLAPDEWREIDLSWYKPKLRDQQATSSCVGHGSVAGMESVVLQAGRPRVEFSPYFTYSLINGGRDQGAMISDALRALQAAGACPDQFMPAGVMYRQQVPQQAFQAAARHRLGMAFRCDDYDEIVSAVCLGFGVVFGILVDNNFPRLDGEGVAPVARRGGGGHCMFACGVKRSSRYGWVLKVQNSWGDRFGMGGYCYLHKGHFQAMHPDAFALQAPADDYADDTPADEVPVLKN